MKKKLRKPIGYKNKEEYIAFRAEKGNIEHINTMRIRYKYGSNSELLRVILNRAIQLFNDNVHIVDINTLEKIIKDFNNNKLEVKDGNKNS